jgi:hypothetical protein
MPGRIESSYSASPRAHLQRLHAATDTYLDMVPGWWKPQPYRIWDWTRILLDIFNEPFKFHCLINYWTLWKILESYDRSFKIRKRLSGQPAWVQRWGLQHPISKTRKLHLTRHFQSSRLHNSLIWLQRPHHFFMRSICARAACTVGSQSAMITRFSHSRTHTLGIHLYLDWFPMNAVLTTVLRIARAKPLVTDFCQVGGQ